MKKIAPVKKVIVYYPTTDEGWRELRRRVAEVHAESVLRIISKLNCPISDKERLLKTIIRDMKEKINNEQKK